MQFRPCATEITAHGSSTGSRHPADRARLSRPGFDLTEENAGAVQRFYGHSFIADHTGEMVQSFGAEAEGVLVHTFDLAGIERYRADWGFFRDRRPDLYARS